MQLELGSLRGQVEDKVQICLFKGDSATVDVLQDCSEERMGHSRDADLSLRDGSVGSNSMQSAWPIG